MNLFIDKKYYDSAIAGDSSVAYGTIWPISINQQGTINQIYNAP